MNKPEFRALRDEDGNLRKTVDGKYIISEFRGNDGQLILLTMSPFEAKNIFIKVYSHNTNGELIDDLTVEEFYIESITDTALLLRSTQEIELDTEFEMIPLDKITKVTLGSK